MASTSPVMERAERAASGQRQMRTRGAGVASRRQRRRRLSSSVKEAKPSSRSPGPPSCTTYPSSSRNSRRAAGAPACNEMTGGVALRTVKVGAGATLSLPYQGADAGSVSALRTSTVRPGRGGAVTR